MRDILASKAKLLDEEFTHLNSRKWRSRKAVVDNVRKIIFDAGEIDEQCCQRLLRNQLVQIVALFELIYDPSLEVRASLKSFVSYLLASIVRLFSRSHGHGGDDRSSRRSSMMLSVGGAGAQAVAAQLAPFADAIATHLNAALSHADASIRSDAQQLLHIVCQQSVQLIALFSMSSLSQLMQNLDSALRDVVSDGDLGDSSATVHLLESIGRVCRALQSLEHSDSRAYREAALVQTVFLRSAATSVSGARAAAAMGSREREIAALSRTLCSMVHSCTVLYQEHMMSEEALANQRNGAVLLNVLDGGSHLLRIYLTSQGHLRRHMMRRRKKMMAGRESADFESLLDAETGRIMMGDLKILTLKVMPTCEGFDAVPVKLRLMAIGLRLSAMMPVDVLEKKGKQCVHEWFCMLIAMLGDEQQQQPLQQEHAIHAMEEKKDSAAGTSLSLTALSNCLKCVKAMVDHRTMLNEEQKMQAYQCVHKTLHADHVLERLRSSVVEAQPSLMSSSGAIELSDEEVIDRFLLSV